MFNSEKKKDKEWLSGVVDSDGCFSLTGRTITFKISVKHTNRQLLASAKNILNCGKIEQYGSMVTLRIKDQTNLGQRVFPIFREVGLFTHKNDFYLKAEQALKILTSDKSIQEQDCELLALKSSWKDVGFGPNINWENGRKPTKSWLIGFIEGDGSFFITKNEEKYIHAFGITQKHDKHVLEWIRNHLKINAKIRIRPKFFHLETKAQKTIEYLINYFRHSFRGVTGLYFSLWARSYKKNKNNSSALKNMQLHMRKLKSKKPIHK